MSSPAPQADDLRAQAARLAAAVLRFEEGAAHLLRQDLDNEDPNDPPAQYGFLPSLRSIPRDEVASFLLTLPSPALFSPTTIRGSIALTLLSELSGERRSGAEKIFSNYSAILDDLGARLGLGPTSRILLEFDKESHTFSFEVLRFWTQQFAAQVGWNMSPLENDPRADARLDLRRGDGLWSDGRRPGRRHG
jgi:hypothetical protein